MSYPSDDTIRTLRRLEALAESIDTRAKWLTDDIAELMMKPAWPTKAEDAIVVARARLERALLAVQTVENRIKSMPVEPNPFDQK